MDTEKLNLAGVGRVQKIAGTTPDGQTDQPRLFLAIGDELGSSSFVIDHQTSEVVERTSFDAYGTVDSDFRSERWGAYRNPHQFTGKEEDLEVGLVYFGARYYHPQLHRWMSPDPLTIHAWGADPNPYAYVSGNVLRLTDPTGLCPENCPRPGDPPPRPEPPPGPGPDKPEPAPDTGTGRGAGGTGLAEAPKPPPPPPPQSSFGTSLADHLVRSVVTRAIPYLSPPVYGRSGVRLGGGVRPLRSAVAQGFQGAGYSALAAIAEAGHGCALCHLIKAHQTLAEADAAIDLAHYDSVAVGVASLRDALVLTILTEGAGLALRGPGAGAAAAEQASAAPSLAVDVDQLAINARNVPTHSGGFFNFVTHGDANSAWVLQDGQWAAMSHRTVARAITGDAAYAGGPVRRIACQSGACATGFARNLSNSLGVPVLAPMGSPIVEAGGVVTGGGAWRLFLPGSPFH